MGFDMYIFDLDGTLIDTRRDITTAINKVLSHYGLAKKSIDEVTGYVGDGIQKFVERCIGDKKIDVDKAVSMFKDFYWTHLVDTTKPYPGVCEVLDHLSDKYKAILTNKSYKFTKAITDKLNLTEKFSEIVGGDSVSKKKPSTEGMEYIISKSGIEREKTVMIGDGKNDILTAKKAGVTSVYVTYGFTDAEKVRSLEPDFIIDTPIDLLYIC